MGERYKPEGYPSLVAYIMADDVAAVTDFIERAFGAREVRRRVRPDGSLGHIEMSIDDSMVMFSEASDAYPAMPTWLHLYLPDVDAAYQRAVAVGGRPVEPPHQNQGDPDRRAGVMDPSGNTWWISTRMAWD